MEILIQHTKYWLSKKEHVIAARIKSQLCGHLKMDLVHFEGPGEQLDLEAPPQDQTCSGGRGTVRLP